jgi:hypothetical protein
VNVRRFPSRCDHWQVYTWIGPVRLATTLAAARSTCPSSSVSPSVRSAVPTTCRTGTTASAPSPNGPSTRGAPPSVASRGSGRPAGACAPRASHTGYIPRHHPLFPTLPTWPPALPISSALRATRSGHGLR